MGNGCRPRSKKNEKTPPKCVDIRASFAAGSHPEPDEQQPKTAVPIEEMETQPVDAGKADADPPLERPDMTEMVEPTPERADAEMVEPTPDNNLSPQTPVLSLSPVGGEVSVPFTLTPPDQITSSSHSAAYKRLQRFMKSHGTTKFENMAKLWSAGKADKNKLLRNWVTSGENADIIEASLQVEISQETKEGFIEEEMTVQQMRDAKIPE